MVEVKMTTQSYFTTEVRGSAKHLSGNENNSQFSGERRRVGANRLRCQFAGGGQVV